MTARGPESAREVARRALRRVISDQAYATLTLSAELDKAGLPPRDRRLATELVYGVCRHAGRLDRAIASATTSGLARVKPAVLIILRVGAYQILLLDRVPDHAAVNDAVSAARRLGGARMAGFVNSVLRRLARDGEPAPPPRERTLEYVEAVCSLPRWIAARLSRQLGGDADELIACAQALGSPAPLALRVNQRRIELGALAERLRADHPGCEALVSPVCPGALVVTGLGDPERSPSFAEGLWTVQDIGAQLVGHLIGAPAPAESGGALRILDACAGLGGKATHLAERFGARAAIDAADRSAAKLTLLDHARQRLGLEPIRIIAADLVEPAAGAAGPALADAYDVVLLDAPCTGLGVLRRHPEAKWRVRESDVAAMAALQRALLDALCARVRPGGVLVYSVCTFTEEEGPAQVRDFLDRHPEFVLRAPEPALDEVLAEPDWSSLCLQPGIMRTWPHHHDADAFFAARLVRTEGGH
jgi:16S rRNA (cytosine967-C5)-methyltransferase